MEYKFLIGGIWEFPDWTIQTDYILENNEHSPCNHCIWSEDGTWIIPFVVIATNEGGYCTTGVCLQCIVEQGEKIINESIQKRRANLTIPAGKVEKNA